MREIDWSVSLAQEKFPSENGYPILHARSENLHQGSSFISNKKQIN